MTHTIAGLWLALGAISLVSCSRAPEGVDPAECKDFVDNDGDRLADCLDPDCVVRGLCDDREGLTASECVDGIDNDDDGYYDCNDFDCFAAPLCNEGGGGVVVVPGGGGGGGGVTTDDTTEPSGPEPFIHDPLSSVELSLTIAFDFDDFGDSLCPLSQVCDCYVSFEGDGTYFGGEGLRGTFEGTWALVDSDCSATSGLQTAIWSDRVAGAAFHTFRWNADGTRVDEWITHRNEDDVDPFQDNQNELGQFWISSMRSDWPGTGAELTYYEQKVDLADLIYITTTFDYTAIFR